MDKCSQCDYQACGDETCQPCVELEYTGLCISCHIVETCTYCSAKINLEDVNDQSVHNLFYQYFCNKDCWQANKDKKG